MNIPNEHTYAKLKKKFISGIAKNDEDFDERCKVLTNQIQNQIRNSTP